MVTMSCNIEPCVALSKRIASSGVPPPGADGAVTDDARLPSANNGDSGVPARERESSLPVRVGNIALKPKQNIHSYGDLVPTTEILFFYCQNFNTLIKDIETIHGYSVENV